MMKEKVLGTLRALSHITHSHKNVSSECNYAKQPSGFTPNFRADLRQITERFCAKLPIKIQKKVLKLLHISKKSSTFALDLKSIQKWHTRNVSQTSC